MAIRLLLAYPPGDEGVKPIRGRLAIILPSKLGCLCVLADPENKNQVGKVGSPDDLKLTR